MPICLWPENHDHIASRAIKLFIPNFCVTSSQFSGYLQFIFHIISQLYSAGVIRRQWISCNQGKSRYLIKMNWPYMKRFFGNEFKGGIRFQKFTRWRSVLSCLMARKFPRCMPKHSACAATNRCLLLPLRRQPDN